MRKSQILSDNRKIDPNVRLWAAVIRRAYMDAIGRVTDVYVRCGKYWNKPENRQKAEQHKEEIIKRLQKDAIRFLRNDYWIFDICDLSQDYTLKMLKKDRQLRSKKQMGSDKKRAKTNTSHSLRS